MTVNRRILGGGGVMARVDIPTAGDSEFCLISTHRVCIGFVILFWVKAILLNRAIATGPVGPVSTGPLSNFQGTNISVPGHSWLYLHITDHCIT